MLVLCNISPAALVELPNGVAAPTEAGPAGTRIALKPAIPPRNPPLRAAAGKTAAALGAEL